jgi:hypothetical protein
MNQKFWRILEPLKWKEQWRNGYAHSLLFQSYCWTIVVSESTQQKTINAKLDRIITMLEEEFKKEAWH